MSEYYRPQRARGLYDPIKNADPEHPFKLSRSKIDLFTQCPKCFYLDRRLGVGRPPGFPFAINSAVDALLKNEFDQFREKGTPHPIIERYGLDAIPAAHPQINDWRNTFKGVQHLQTETNLLVFGAIDDLWKNLPSSPNEPEKFLVVDYKATAKDEDIIALDKPWHDGYKRQMEVYQWLLRHNGLDVSDTGYFVYCNGKANREAFCQHVLTPDAPTDGPFLAHMDFELTLIGHTGTVAWIEPTLHQIHACLNSDNIPDSGADCDYCAYREATTAVDPRE